MVSLCRVRPFDDKCDEVDADDADDDDDHHYDDHDVDDDNNYPDVEDDDEPPPEQQAPSVQAADQIENIRNLFKRNHTIVLMWTIPLTVNYTVDNCLHCKVKEPEEARVEATMEGLAMPVGQNQLTPF